MKELNNLYQFDKQVITAIVYKKNTEENTKKSLSHINNFLKNIFLPKTIKTYKTL